MDENFQTYLNRAMRLTLPETYRSQVQHIQESPKFRPHPELGRQAVPFPGYSVITPPTESDPSNAALYTDLTQFQQQLLDRMGPQQFALVPPESFHLTLADLIWDSAYRHAAENPDFDSKLRDQIRQIFEQTQSLSTGKGVSLQAIGLMMMTRAIAICLVPTDEPSYDRLLKFRRAIYQNQGLMGLGIEQQYYFTPHITIGYFGEVPTAEGLSTLSGIFEDLNQQWLEKDPQTFWVQRAELHKFDDMTNYYREPDWPTFSF